jgi:Transposase IS116/IS110/IS902 family
MPTYWHLLESYLGLVPRESSTGDKRRLGSISKAVNCYLRALLVETAWSIFKRVDANDPLRKWAEALAKRRGNRIAVIALARRLAGVLWAMWRAGTYYDSTQCGQHDRPGNPETERQKALAKASARKVGRVHQKYRHAPTMPPESQPRAARKTAVARSKKQGVAMSVA